VKQEAKQREAKQASRSKTRETQPLWGCVSLAKGKPWPHFQPFYAIFLNKWQNYSHELILSSHHQYKLSKHYKAK
jgi:hypothetical protein